MKIIPVADRILVVRLKEKEFSDESRKIKIPESSKEPSQMGKVVSVGPGRVPDGPIREAVYIEGSYPNPAADGIWLSVATFFWTILNRFRRTFEYAAPVVKEGDVVMFGRFAGMEISLNREAYFLLRQDEVVAIIEGALAELTDVEVDQLRDAAVREAGES